MHLMSSLHTLIDLCYSVTALFTCQGAGNADPFGSLKLDHMSNLGKARDAKRNICAA